MIANYPGLVLSACVIFMLIFAAISFSGVLPVDEAGAASPGQILALRDERVQQTFAAQALSSFTEDPNRLTEPLTEQHLTMLMTFEARQGENLFSQASLAELFEWEQALMGRALASSPYPADVAEFEDFCWKPDGANCMRPLSVLGSVVFWNETASGVDWAAGSDNPLASLTQEEIDARICDATSEAALADAGRPSPTLFFTSDFLSRRAAAGDCSTAGLEGHFSRSLLYFGGPLGTLTAGGDRRFANTDSDSDAQAEEYGTFMRQYLDLVDQQPARTFIHYAWEDDALGPIVIQERYVNKDIQLTAVAGSMVFVVVALQTGSIFLSVCGVLGTVWSYPMALVLYHGVFGIGISPQMNMLALFLILGIGADDIFVFIDAWEQSEHEPESTAGHPDDYITRTAYVWRRASTAMLTTSLTTAIAFLMTALSPIPAVGAFGVMAATMVIVNYLTAITFLPALVVFWSQVLRWDRQCCCLAKSPAEYCSPGCSTRRGTPSEGRTSPTINPGLAPRSAGAQIPKPGPELTTTPTPLAQSAPSGLDKAEAAGQADSATDEFGNVDGYKAVERFCLTVWSPLIFKLRYIIIAVGLGLLVAGAVGMSQLKPPSEVESGLPDDDPLIVMMLDILPRFPPNPTANLIPVEIVFGVDADNAIDRGSLDPNDEIHPGDPVIDPSFHLHRPEVLLWIADVCGTVDSWDTPGGGPLVIPGSPIDCRVRELVVFLRAAGEDPANATQYPYHDDPQGFAQRVWDFASGPHADAVEVFGGIGSAGSRAAVRRVEWFRIAANSSIPGDAGLPTMEEHVRGWDGVAATFASAAGAPTEGVGTPFASSWFVAWWSTSRVLTSATFSSLAISFGVSCIVMLAIIANWIVSLLAALTVACVVVTTLGSIVAGGGSLGLVQAIVTTVLAGLAVDFTVHFAVHMAHSHRKGRVRRTQEALFHLGVSVVGGALTSVLSSAILLAASLNFFSTWGKYMVVTIALSFLWSTTLLPALLMTFGPDDEEHGRLQLCGSTSQPDERPGGKANTADRVASSGEVKEPSDRAVLAGASAV